MPRKIKRLLIATASICLVIIIGGKGVSAIINKSASNPPAKKIVENVPQGNGNVAQGSNQNTQSGQSSTVNEYALENATFVNAQGQHVIKSPDNLLVLVNKSRNLPEDYVPKDLVVPNVTFATSNDTVKHLRKPAADALEKLFAQAKAENINLAAVSGYRPYDMQQRIFQSNVKNMGEKAATQVSAYPGQSEHQTGLAMDVSSASAKFALEDTFGDTKEGKWLKENAANFGFVIRYPKDKVNITKYSYEPWHIRYVGKDVAVQVMSQGITLEEYFNAVE